MQTLVTWIIIGLAAVFVARWAYRKITGKAPECCSGNNDPSACPCCIGIDQCPADSSQIPPGKQGTGL